MSASELIVQWYQNHARELPWRQEGVSAWGILVSEFMLQQTQVDRVLPRWLAWMERWPTPADLAAAPVHEAIVAWDRLGYPRRALWLHRAATTIVEDHDGQVPTQLDALLALTGVGEYTARAVAVFAHRQRHPVLDTNVRRVLARLYAGKAQAGPPNWVRDLVEAAEHWPEDPEQARLYSYAVMEFGAVICTARTPKCGECPVRQYCAWANAGYPEYSGARIKPQARFEGSDREARGQMMALLRANPGQHFEAFELLALIPDADRAKRALQSLVRDGLVQADTEHEVTQYRLPTTVSGIPASG